MQPKKIYLKPLHEVDLIVALYQIDKEIIAIDILSCATEIAWNDCRNFYGAITDAISEKASVRIGKNTVGTNFVLTVRVGESCKTMRKRQYEITEKMARQLVWLREWSESHGKNGKATYFPYGSGFILRKNTD